MTDAVPTSAPVQSTSGHPVNATVSRADHAPLAPSPPPPEPVVVRESDEDYRKRIEVAISRAQTAPHDDAYTARGDYLDMIGALYGCRRAMVPA